MMNSVYDIKISGPSEPYFVAFFLKISYRFVKIAFTLDILYNFITPFSWICGDSNKIVNIINFLLGYIFESAKFWQKLAHTNSKLLYEIYYVNSILSLKYEFFEVTWKNNQKNVPRFYRKWAQKKATETLIRKIAFVMLFLSWINSKF